MSTEEKSGFFAQFEQNMASTPRLAFDYALMLNQRFLQGEPTIALDSNLSFLYAFEIVKGPFPQGELAISRSTEDSFAYAIYVLRAPFPAGEEAIKRNPGYWSLYTEKFGIVSDNEGGTAD